MAKKGDGEKSNVRRLPGAGDGPLEPEDPRVVFVRRVGAVIDSDCDQIIIIPCRGGRIQDIFGLRDNRHEIRGVLGEALPEYDGMTMLMFVDD